MKNELETKIAAGVCIQEMKRLQIRIESEKYEFPDTPVLSELNSLAWLPLYVDMAYYCTCCCIVGLSVERYILICLYDRAKSLLTKKNRVKMLLVSTIATLVPSCFKVAEHGEISWIVQVCFTRLLQKANYYE